MFSKCLAFAELTTFKLEILKLQYRNSLNIKFNILLVKLVQFASSQPDQTSA